MEYLPAPHGIHVVAPIVVENVPSRQDEHHGPFTPAQGEYLPAAHGTHMELDQDATFSE